MFSLFRPVRLRLTLLYLAAAVLLIGLVGGGAYGLLYYYFRATTDGALRYRMVQAFQELGAPIPPELAAAAGTWYGGRAAPVLGETAGMSATARREPEDDHHQDEDHGLGTYDGELAAIFVAPLDRDGALLAGAASASLPAIRPDRQAAAAALARGSDLRTVRLSSGARLRLLTYRLPSTGVPGGPVLLQAGRTLADQDRLMRQLVLGLSGLGAASTLLLTGASWWLAGRSLLPAQQAWVRQQTFVANAGHELRAPLTLLRASAEVALRSTPPEDTDQRALLHDVLEECDHMARLVDDLLLLSRLDAGRLPLERAAVPVGELLADIERQVGRLADARGTRLTALPGAGGAVWADPVRLRQVLIILLDNALRHTPPGGTIRLEARREGRHVHLIVADSGSGIAPEHLPHVFERFYQVDGARSDRHGGSGLGLAIARALITSQQGTIWLESREGEGTRAHVVLPAAPESTPAAPGRRRR